MLATLRSFRRISSVSSEAADFLVARFVAASVDQKFKNMSMKALVILSPGAEEMEFTASVDVLRRAGVNVTVGGLLGCGPVKCARNVIIFPDAPLEGIQNEEFHAIIMPGGLGGAKAMCESQILGKMLKKQATEGRIVAAICAAPTALLAHDICPGARITSYPSVKEQLEGKYKYIEGQRVVEDGNLITSRGPATALDFALAISYHLAGCDKTAEVAKAMLIK